MSQSISCSSKVDQVDRSIESKNKTEFLYPIAQTDPKSDKRVVRKMGDKVGKGYARVVRTWSARVSVRRRGKSWRGRGKVIKVLGECE